MRQGVDADCMTAMLPATWSPLPLRMNGPRIRMYIQEDRRIHHPAESRGPMVLRTHLKMPLVEGGMCYRVELSYEAYPC